MLPTPYRYLYSKAGRDVSQCLSNFYKLSSIFVVRDENTKCYYAFRNIEEFIEFHESHPQIDMLHEVITENRSRKLMFDIDISHIDLKNLNIPSAEITSLYINEINKNLNDIYKIKNPDIIICDSSKEGIKFSQHYIVNNYSITGNTENEFFAKWVNGGMGVLEPFMDKSIYSATHNFRLPDMKKPDGRVKRIISGHKYADAIIQNTKNCKPIMEITDGEPTKRVGAVNVNDDGVAAILDLIKPHTNGFEFVECSNSLLKFRRLRPTECELCKRTHDSDSLYGIMFNDGVVLRCHRDETKKSIKINCIINGGKVSQKPKKELKDSIYVAPPQDWTIYEYDEPLPMDFDFNYLGEHDTLVVKSQMGTGKSVRLCQWLNKLFEETPDQQVIVISFRKSFTDEMKSKLPGGFVSYLDSKNFDDNRLIIQYDSLKKLKLKPGPVVILDESESIINQIENVSNINDGERCFQKFEWLITYAKKLILMDAFVSARTYTLASVRKKVLMHINKYQPDKGADDFIYTDENNFFEHLDRDIAGADKAPIAVVCTSKKKALAIADIAKRKNKRVKCYHGDMSEDMRAELGDVNTNWKQCDVLIYTSTILAGMNFNQKHYSHLYMYLTPQHINADMSAQMSKRVRDLGLKTTHVFIKTCTFDGPLSLEEIENSIRVGLINKQGILSDVIIGGIKTGMYRTPVIIAANGIDYEVQHDLCYNLHILNILYRSQCKSMFMNMFIKLRTEMGIKVTMVRDKTENKVMSTSVKTIINENTVADAARVAGAEIVPDDMLETQKKKIQLTQAEKDNIKLTELRNFYNIPDNMKLTPEFIKKYDKNDQKAQFYYMNLVERNGNNIEESLLKINSDRRLPLEGLTNYEKIFSKDTTIKLGLAYKLLNMVMNASVYKISNFPSANLMRFAVIAFTKLFCEREVGLKDSYKHLLGLNLDKLKQHAVAGEIRFVSKMINNIITKYFGVKLETISVNKKASDNMKLCPASPFKFVNGKFVVVEMLQQVVQNLP